MKIGIDARKISNFGDKSNFIKFFINALNNQDSKNNYIIYTNSLFKNINLNKNFTVKNIKCDFSGVGQFKFSKTLKQDLLDLVIFFDYDKPLFYHGKYFAFPWGLENLFFPSEVFNSSFSKIKYNLLSQLYVEKAEKMFVFYDEMKQDLNDKLNIKEDRIIVLNPPLFKYANKSINTNVKLRHSINKDYFIMQSEGNTSNNLDRIIKIIGEINADSNKEVDLIIIGNKAAHNIGLRDLVVRKNLQKHIHFVGDISPSEEESYYNKSIGYIYADIYSIYPFSLSKAVNYNTFILGADLSVMKKIFGKKIAYFNPLSDFEIKQALLKQMAKPSSVNYKGIYEKFELDATKIIKQY